MHCIAARPCLLFLLSGTGCGGLTVRSTDSGAIDRPDVRDTMDLPRR